MSRHSNIRRRARKNLRGGFTLVEIMIVVFIIAVLLNIATPGFIHARDGQSWQRTCCTNLHNISPEAKEQSRYRQQCAASTYTPVWSDLGQYIQAGSTAPHWLGDKRRIQFNDINTESRMHLWRSVRPAARHSQ